MTLRLVCNKKMIKLAFARKGQDDRTKTQNVLLK